MRITLFNIALPSIALLFAIAALPIRAQLPMAEGPTAERGQRESDRDLEERIANMRYLAALAEKRGSRRKDPKLALEELQEDFTRLQIVNKELVLTTAKSKDIDLKFVVKRAAKINKHAARLQSNLVLPDPETAGHLQRDGPISDAKQLKASITRLGWLIYNFAKNPIFKEAKVIETPAAAKVRGDLERIIELSLHLKKNSEQLGKLR
jgi:hypothetical protein